MGACDPTALTVEAADGRELEVLLFGPEDGTPLFSHHGTPGAAGMFEPMVTAGAARGVRHITYSRPGYGGSTRHPGRAVRSCVADVAAVADALAYERFHSIGASGGGHHSIACAALLPERVISAVAIAAPAPLHAEGLDWTAGMGTENIAELDAARSGDGEFRAYLEDEVAQLRRASPSDIAAMLGDIVSEVDRRAISGAFAEHLVAEFRSAVAPGVWGWFDDDRALFGDWGFPLDDIEAPLTLWHGAQDGTGAASSRG